MYIPRVLTRLEAQSCVSVWAHTSQSCQNHVETVNICICVVPRSYQVGRVLSKLQHLVDISVDMQRK